MSRPLALIGPFPPPEGGVAQFNTNLAYWLRQQGVSHSILPYSDAKYAGVVPINLSFLGFLPHAMRLPRNAVCVDSSGWCIEYPVRGAIRAWSLARLLRRYYWLKVIHDGSLPQRYSDSRDRERQIIQRTADAVDEYVVVGPQLADWLRRELNARQPVHVIPSLLPLRCTPEVEVAPVDGNVDQDSEFTVLCAGAFAPVYGFLDVAIAVERLRIQRGIDVSLCLIDAGFTDNNAYRSKVLADRPWISTKGALSHDDLMRTFKRCDVYVRACQYEGYGLSRVEALWCGLPVVATRAGEQRGMLLFDFGDVTDLQNKIWQALEARPRVEEAHWAQVLRTEAESNLEKWARLLAERCECP